MDEFRELLRSRLTGRGDLARLSEVSGIASHVIGRWRDGDGRPTDTNLKRLAPALGVPYEELAKMCGYLPGELSPALDPGKAEWNALYDRMHPETRSTVVPMVRAAANTAGTGTANQAGHPRNGRGRKTAAADKISSTRGLVLARSTAVLAWICRPLHPLGVPTAATA